MLYNVILAILPCVCTLAMHIVIEEVTFIFDSIRPGLLTLPMPFVFLKVT